MKRKRLTLAVLVLFVFAISISAYAVFEINSDEGIVRIMGDINIAQDRVVNGDVVAILGDIKVGGVVNGDVVAILGNIEANNFIGGDVVSILGEINQGNNAHITGNLTEVASLRIFSFGLPALGFLSWGFKIFRLLIFAALSILIFSLLPEQEKNMAERIETDFSQILLKGLISLVALPVIVIALMISILGITLIPVFILAIIISVLIAHVAIAFAVGERVAVVGNLDLTVFPQLLVGITVLWAVRAIPLLGSLAGLLLFILALGLVIDTRFGTDQPWFKEKKDAKQDNSEEDI